jgi:predicted NUDIX family phosphoesterase/dephospho-CoA kinase
VKSEFLIVAKRLMEEQRRPLSPKELVELGQPLFSDNIAGRTPWQTMKSKLSVHIRRYGEVSPFVRTGPGKFYLRALLNGAEQAYQAKPIRPPKSQEKVVVFETTALDKVTTWQGLRANWRTPAKLIFDKLMPFYLPRYDIEQKDSYTQLLTYVLVRHGDSLLTYRRGTYTRAAQFLQGSFCVGFGGHVVEEDLDLFSLETMGVFECAARELNEELCLPAEDREQLKRYEGLEILGIINDDSSDVGRRHIAFVMQYRVSSNPRWKTRLRDWNPPLRNEKGITQLQWISTQHPGGVLLWNFEYWSQLCLREFAPELVLARPAYRIVRKARLRPPDVLCVVGPVGSGKTLATAVLKSDFGYEEINTGRTVAELLGIPPVPTTPRAEFQAQAWAFISHPNGPKRLARRLADLITSSSSARILVDGLRQRATIKLLRQECSGHRVGLLFVHTPADLAYRFYAKRVAQGASIADFLAARGARVESEVQGLIADADAVLYNWTGTLEYRNTIRQMMSELGIRRR